MEGVPIEVKATIKSCLIQFKIHSFQKDKIFIYWKELEKIGECNKPSAEKLKLLDFAFRNASTAILLVWKDATFYDFNDFLLSLLGYDKDEVKLFTVINIDPNFNKLTCKERWVEFRIIKQGLLLR